MAHLIDKDALVAEIESKKEYAQTLGDNAINSSMQQFYDGMKQGCVDILSFIDTLQEEPVAPKVLEDMLNAKTAAESLGISQEEHDRIIDECLYGKEPEMVDVDDLPTKKDYRERYKRIAESEEFRKNHDGMSIGDIVPIEGEEPVSEDLEQTSKEWLTPQLDKSYAAYGETKQMELTRFDGYAMLDAIEFGAKWQFERVNEALLSEVLPCFMHGGEADEVVAKLDEVLNQKK